MKRALRSIQLTDAGRLMLVPRLAAGLPMLLAGSAHYVRPSLIKLTLAEAGAPLQPWLATALPCVAIVAGILLVLGYFGRIAAFLSVQITMLSLLALVKLQELPWIDARAASWLPPAAIPLTVIISAFAVLIFGSGACSVDREDTETSFGDPEDLYTEFEVLDSEHLFDHSSRCTIEPLAV